MRLSALANLWGQPSGRQFRKWSLNANGLLTARQEWSSFRCAICQQLVKLRQIYPQRVRRYDKLRADGAAQTNCEPLSATIMGRKRQKPWWRHGQVAN